jgi:predicted signal transduction protein with EAL and GGDEF domain
MLGAPFRIGDGALGAAALHPSMIRLDAPQPRLSYRGRRRLPGILVTMVVGAVVLPAEPADNTTNRTVLAVLFGELLLGVLLRSERAVSGFAASEHAARYQSTHDALTGLPNQALLHARATEQLDASSGPARPSMLFIDLDGFKFVNDSYGHNVGDELLIATAERLANRIVTVFSEPFALSVGRVYVSASIGIARSGTSSQASDIESLIREADAAMYHAKAHGRGGYAFFDDSLRAQARIQMGVAHRVRTVLAETGLPGHALWFELTETAFVDDTEAALRALQALRTLGSMICVDDFGTGYSVLGYMHQGS